MGPNESLIKVVIIIILTIYLQRTSNKILINKHGSPCHSGGWWWWCSGSGATVVVLVLLVPLSPLPLLRCWLWGLWCSLVLGALSILVWVPVLPSVSTAPWFWLPDPGPWSWSFTPHALLPGRWLDCIYVICEWIYYCGGPSLTIIDLPAVS